MRRKRVGIALSSHRSLGALSITRMEFSHVVLRRQSAESCDHTSVIRALGLNNDHLYAETPSG
jgi:hypothetical protein